MAGKKRVGIVLFQLGGPDSLQTVEPFLLNLFLDPDIIPLGPLGILRRPIAKLSLGTKGVAFLPSSRCRANPEVTGNGKLKLGQSSPRLQNEAYDARRMPPYRGKREQVARICGEFSADSGERTAVGLSVQLGCNKAFRRLL